MSIGLRVRRLGTIVGAIVFFLIISIVAARLVLSRDLIVKGQTEVTNGGGAFSGYWDSRKSQIKRLVGQDAAEDILRRDLQSGNTTALRDQLSFVLQTSGLSFLTVVDTSFNVVARGNGPHKGSLDGNNLISRALTGETVSSATLLDPSFLAGEGLLSQAESDITGTDGTTVAHVDKGLSIVTAAPIRDRNERTIGVLYGGILMNHSYALVDQVTRALGGRSAILEGNAIVASTIQGPNGTRTVDLQVTPGANVVKDGKAYTGTSIVGRREYFVYIDPITDDENKVIGARWYGVPMAKPTRSSTTSR
jgi:Single cache domain 3